MRATPCVCQHAIPSINRRSIWDTTAYFQLKILTLGCGNEVIEMELTKQLPLKRLPINYHWNNKNPTIGIISSNKDPEVILRIWNCVSGSKKELLLRT